MFVVRFRFMLLPLPIGQDILYLVRGSSSVKSRHDIANLAVYPTPTSSVKFSMHTMQLWFRI